MDDGRTCAKLDADNLCTIYADRPLVCQIDALGDHLGVSDKTQWHQAHAHLCNLAQIEDGMPEKYRVKVAQSPSQVLYSPVVKEPEV